MTVCFDPAVELGQGPSASAQSWDIALAGIGDAAPDLSDERWRCADLTSPYTARCPSCGEDAKWRARLFTHSANWRRVTYEITCPTTDCAPRDTNPPHQERSAP